MNIYLIGFRGTGKTSTARLLAELLGRRWIDADALLEERAGMTIREIFAREGETGFRQREAEVLRDLASQDDWIVATGGGVILREENRRLLGQGRVVWLKASADVIWRRLQADTTTTERRPNLTRGGLEEIEELLQSRGPLYETCAQLEVETNQRSPRDVAGLVQAWLADTKGG